MYKERSKAEEDRPYQNERVVAKIGRFGKGDTQTGTLRILFLSTMEKVSFHHGESFFPPWWKEKSTTAERIRISRRKNKDWGVVKIHTTSVEQLITEKISPETFIITVEKA